MDNSEGIEEKVREAVVSRAVDVSNLQVEVGGIASKICG